MRSEVAIYRSKRLPSEPRLSVVRLNYLELNSPTETDFDGALAFHLMKSNLSMRLYKVTLDIGLSKNGSLCEGSCDSLKATLTAFKKCIGAEFNEVRSELLLDFEKMIHAGGITYYLPMQLQLLNSQMNLKELRIELSSQSFNSQCLAAVSPSLLQLKHLSRFEFASKMSQTSIQFLHNIPSQELEHLEIDLSSEPSEGIEALFSALKRFTNVRVMGISLRNSNEETIEQLNKYIASGQKSLREMQIGLVWDEMMLLKRKNEFYNSLSQNIQLLRKKSINLTRLALDLSGVEDSSLKSDVIEELVTQNAVNTLTHLSLTFHNEVSMKTELLSFLYKIAAVISKAKSLHSLTLNLNIPKKFMDIISQHLKVCSANTIIFNQQAGNNGRIEHLVLSENSAEGLQRVEGIHLSSPPRFLVHHSLPICSNSTDIAIHRLARERRRLIAMICAMEQAEILKRKEEIIEVIQNYSVGQ